MIGIIPGSTKTFEVMGDFSDTNPIEGKLYYNRQTGRLFMYSKYQTRSNPDTGFFPIWNGEKTFISGFSNEKYIEKDVTMMDVNQMSSSISPDTADQVRYRQRRCDNDKILEPSLSDGDNWFTQCIKGCITAKKLTMVDLVDMTSPPMEQSILENYYSALNKIAFMRIDKWKIWIDHILHLGYKISVSKDGEQLIEYSYPDNTYHVNGNECDDIIKEDIDSLKKIVKVVMKLKNIKKANLKADNVDDYTINNMLTTINGNKALSAQIFSRFMRMADMSYNIQMYDGNDMIFEYHE